MSTCHSDDSGRRNLSPRSPPGLALAGAVGERRDSSSQTPRNDGVGVLVPVITPTPLTVIPTTPLTVIPTTPLTVIPTTPGGGISALAAHPVLRLPGQWAGEEIPRRRLLGMTVWAGEFVGKEKAAIGIEPMMEVLQTSALATWLRRLALCPKKTRSAAGQAALPFRNGAGDEIRTRDFLLGKQMLYH